MISKDKRCIFIHIPKTAGTSIEKLIQGENYTKGWSSHKKLYEYQDEDNFEKYFKFAFVRNPYSRILSVFNYYKNGGNDRGLILRPKKIYNYILKKITTNNILDIDIARKIPNDFDEFCELFIKEKMDFYGRNTLDTQLSFIQINEEIAVDFIGRLESINKDIEVIKTKFNIKLNLEHKRRTKKTGHYSNYYNDFTKKIISNAFAEEIDFFEYKFKNQ